MRHRDVPRQPHRRASARQRIPRGVAGGRDDHDGPHPYRCPLPHWRHRETHIVARTGTDGLGRWIDEERPVLADHQAAIGGPAPSRVVRAWLIAQTVPQAGHAAGEFRRIDLVEGDQTLRVL